MQAILISSVLVLTACESKWEKMLDDELASKASECDRTASQGAAMIQVCKNYRRECERRLQEKGRYIC